MKHIFLLIISLFTAFFTFAQQFVDPETPAGTLPTNTHIGTNWTLDFSDEFNGASVDLTKWTIDNSTKSRSPRPNISVKKWFWRPANVEVRDGNVILKVKKEDSETMHCGAINSRDKYMTTFGYFEARIKIADVNKGTHTAFWLQGPNMGNIDGTGNDGAEIDIFESAWTGNYTKSVIHIDGYGAETKANTKQYSTPGIHSGYHTWGMLWTPDYIKIYYDGVFKVHYSVRMWIPQVDEFLWLSDGASFGETGDRFFVNQPLGWLTEAYVDYIRVWKVGGTVVEPETNLVVNGFFNNGGDNWSKNNSDIVFEDNAETGINGTTCRMPGAGNGRNIQQVIDVVPGNSYSLSLMGRIQNAVGASGTQPNNHTTLGTATLKAEILTSTNDVLLSLTSQSPEDEEMSGSFTVPAGVTSITVKLSKDWNIAYLDDVIIEPLDASAVDKTEQNQLKIITTSNQLRFDTEIPMASLRIYDMRGTIVTSLTPHATHAVTHALVPGIYFAEVAFADGKRVARKVQVR
jgi:beta-glucanase (GH16 family)